MGGVALQHPAENTVLENGLTSVWRRHSVSMLWLRRRGSGEMYIFKGNAACSNITECSVNHEEFTMATDVDQGHLRYRAAETLAAMTP